jgi:hypothetical protein
MEDDGEGIDERNTQRDKVEGIRDRGRKRERRGVAQLTRFKPGKAASGDLQAPNSGILRLC